MQLNLRASLPALYERYGQAAVDSQLAALQRHGDLVDDPELWLRSALAGNFKFMPIERVERCPCGSSRTVHICRFRYWNLLGVRQCEQCGVLFVSPRLTEQAMASVFEEHYFDYADLELWGKRRKAVFDDIMRILRAHHVRAVFDVGAAYGHFVKYANDAGVAAAGSDISQRAVAIGRERLGVKLHAGPVSDLALPEGSVDAVVSLDTFYYVADPLTELETMRRLVRPGGILVLRLRNSLLTRMSARARFREISRPLLPAPHLWGHTSESITRWLESSGWAVKQCEPAAYSRSRLAALQAVGLELNRFARRAWSSAPILTRSFNVVAQRA